MKAGDLYRKEYIRRFNFNEKVITTNNPEDFQDEKMVAYQKEGWKINLVIE